MGGQGEKTASQPDELIDFAHLKARQGLSQLELEDEVATDLQRATGLANAEAADGAGLNRVLQLSGAPRAAARAPQTAACAGACACAAGPRHAGWEVVPGGMGDPLQSMYSAPGAAARAPQTAVRAGACACAALACRLGEVAPGATGGPL